MINITLNKQEKDWEKKYRINLNYYFVGKIQKTNKKMTAEVHANIVVIVSLYADCRTKRTRVHEEHKSQRRSHLTYSQSQVLFIYYLYILNIDSCQRCRL